MIAQTLFSAAQQKLLGLLFVRVNQGFHLSELMHYQRRLREQQPFLMQVLQQSKIFVVGDESQLKNIEAAGAQRIPK